MARVADYMSKNVFTVSKESTVKSAVELMRKKKVGSVLVLAGKKIVGIFTERDFIYKIAKGGEKPIADIKIREIMTKNIKTVDSEEDHHKAIEFMRKNKIRYLPVTRKGKMVGIISISDLLDRYREELRELLSRQEEKLREQFSVIKSSEEKFRTIFDNSALSIIMVSADNRIINCNPSAEKLLGIKAKEIEGKTVAKLYAPGGWNRMIGRDKSRKEITRHVETKVLGKKKGPIDVSVSISVYKGSGGRVKGRIIIMKDITERKKLELFNEERYRNVVGSISDVILRLSPKGNIQYISPNLEAAYGYRPNDLIGKHLRSVVSAKDGQKVDGMIEKALRGEEIKNFEVTLLDKKGNTVVMDSTMAPVKSAEKVVALQGVMHDITRRIKAEQALVHAYHELKITQEQLIQSAKMAALGQLAGGVAHEIKNPLAVILQCANFIEYTPTIGAEKRQEKLDMIKEAVFRADKILKGLLTFSKPVSLALQYSSINKMLEESLVLVEKQMVLTNIKKTEKFTQGMPDIMADEGQIKQAFMNIILNSVQAMPNGGELIIRTYVKKLTGANESVSERTTDYFKLGDTVIVCEIIDTGIGIPGDKINKVFDPFFTTKPTGTGLGLSVTSSIIERHRGIINIESEKDKGTKVTIMLPIIKPSEASPVPTTDSGPQA